MAAFLRASNGNPATVQTPTFAQLHPSISVTDDTGGSASGPISYSLASIPLAGSVNIASGATVAGGNALAVVSLANTHVDAGANLSGNNMLLVGDSVTVVNNSAF